MILDTLDIFVGTQGGRTAFIESNAINVLIDLCHAIADNPHLVNAQLDAEEKSHPASEREQALMLLTEIWRLRPDVVLHSPAGDRVPEAILSVLKKGCRDPSRTVSVVAMHLMADLLVTLSDDRNAFAPRVYKAMTFFLIENCWDEEVRYEMYRIFTRVFSHIPAMPVQILCQPLLKQFQLNLLKAESSDRASVFQLSTHDLEFLVTVASHPKLTEGVSVQLIDISLTTSR